MIWRPRYGNRPGWRATLSSSLIRRSQKGRCQIARTCLLSPHTYCADWRSIRRTATCASETSDAQSGILGERQGPLTGLSQLGLDRPQRTLKFEDAASRKSCTGRPISRMKYRFGAGGKSKPPANRPRFRLCGPWTRVPLGITTGPSSTTNANTANRTEARARRQRRADRLGFSHCRLLSRSAVVRALARLQPVGGSSSGIAAQIVARVAAIQ